MANVATQTVTINVKGLDIDDINRMKQKLEAYRNVIVLRITEFQNAVKDPTIVRGAIKGSASGAYAEAVNRVAEDEQKIVNQLTNFITALDKVKANYQAGDQNRLSNTFKAVK